jgi:tetratricopeptide (TPR) repeat protein
MTTGSDGKAIRSQPYVGLRAFRAEDKAVFFGRLQESIEIARIWRSNKLTVLYGASGVGKTSLLQAGVAPVIDQSLYEVLPIGRIQPDLTFLTGNDQAAGGNPYTLSVLSSWAPTEPVTGLTDLRVTDFFTRRGQSHDSYGDVLPTLIAIDQFEELFGGLPLRQHVVDAFINELAEALTEHAGLRLLIALREDYLASLLPSEFLIGGQARMRSRLVPFGSSAALDAIKGPAAQAGLPFEPGAAEALVEELRTVPVTNSRGDQSVVTVDSIEPASIQIVCSELWDAIPAEAKVITKALVEQHADVDRSLGSFFGRVLGEVADRHGIAAAEIRRWLRLTFITEHGTRGTAYEGIDETAGMVNRVVRELEDWRILKAEYRAGTRWYELQHDRLINPIRQADAKEQLIAAKQAANSGLWEQAKSYAVQAIRSAFGTDELRLRGDAERLLGDVCAEFHEPDTALKHYRTAAGLHELIGDPVAVGESLAAAGHLSVALGDYAGAIADLQGALARSPAEVEVQVQVDLARAMWHLGRPQVAVPMLSNVLNVNGQVTSALRARGEILADLEDSAGALRDLDRVRENQTAETMAARALALALVDRLDAAGQEAADAFANGQHSGPALLRVARVAAIQGRPARAAEIARLALDARKPEALPYHLVDVAQDLIDRSAD